LSPKAIRRRRRDDPRDIFRLLAEKLRRADRYDELLALSQAGAQNSQSPTDAFGRTGDCELWFSETFSFTGLIPSVLKRRNQPVKYGRFPDLQNGLGKVQNKKRTIIWIARDQPLAVRNSRALTTLKPLPTKPSRLAAVMRAKR
jgi:hypothetical protein